MHVMKYPIHTNQKWLVTALLSMCCFLTIFAQFTPPTSVIINEINYRTDTPGDFTEYIELHNPTSSAINLNGWLVEGIGFTFSNVSIPANGYLIIAQDVNDVQALFSIPGGVNVVGPFTGALKNSGEDVLLRDNNGFEVDFVDYNNWNEWPSTGHLEDDNLSLQLVNKNLPGNHAGSWAADFRTPGAPNSGVAITNYNQRPIIQNVRRSPDTPLSNESVRVRAEFDQDNLTVLNNLQVDLEYKVLNPGTYEEKDHSNYNSGWTTMVMNDNGTGPDSTANNGVFTAEIPASAHGHRDLVRYRVKVSNGAAFSATYPDQNYDESNYAYYVYDGYPTQSNIDLNTLPEIQDITIFSDLNNTLKFIGSDDGNHIAQHPTNEILGYGAVIYDGRVYDHIRFRPRHAGSRPDRVKPGIRIKLNREHSFETQNDCGQTYDEDRGGLALSGGWVHDEGAHGLVESLIYKILTLVGSIERAVNYTQLRVVDEAAESNSNGGDFWGLYLIMEDYGGDLIDEHNQLGEGNFWNTDRSINRQRQMDYLGHFPDSELIQPWADSTLTNITTGRAMMDSDLDLEMMYADRIANVIYGQNGTNYIGKHSYREYYNSVTGKHFAWWGDMDNAFGAPIDDGMVFLRDDLVATHHLINRIFVDPTDKIAYQNQMRSVYDLLMNGDHDNSSSVDPYQQIDFLVDEESKLIHNYGTAHDWMEVDQKRWGHVYNATSPTSTDLTADAHVDWYKQWFRDRAAYMVDNDGPRSTNINFGSDVADEIFDPEIPQTPTIAKAGPAGYAIDALNFTNSTFLDSNGNTNTFEAQEWRIAEWSDPSNPFYDTKCKSHYEIETVWASGEIPTDNSTFSFNDATNLLEPGRTYKVRMRHKDDDGRWSHWSDAITFIAEDLINPPSDVIVFTEIHYNPSVGCSEFVEIHNPTNSSVNLSGYNVHGLNFTFPPLSIIGPGEYKIIVEDIDCFNARFSSAPPGIIIGEFSGGLSNSGEELRLEFNGARLDSVRYDDTLPWDTLADNGLHSLALIDIQLDNNLAVNWSTQCLVFETPGEPNDFTGCDVFPDLSNLLINEIKYGTGPAEFIELKNCGATPLDVQGLQLSGLQVDMQIQESIVIPPNSFIVLAADSTAFNNSYGMNADAIYTGSLNPNGVNGESLILTDFFGNSVDLVSYNNLAPWPINLGGSSMGVIDCGFDNDSPVNWSKQNTTFTPFAENTFGADALPDYSAMRINEIHYSATNVNEEFIELSNTSFLPIYLTDLKFAGVTFTFADSDVLAPFGYFVIARNATDFSNKYGFLPDASYNGAGNLSNAGENLRIVDLFNNLVDQVNYDDVAPWDSRADDGVHSLALKISASDNSLPQNWSIQCDDYTPKAQNNFDDDNDSVCNNQDSCPNFNDLLIGTACSDGDPCTVNDVYTNSCECVGTPSGDSDNDGICDAVDNCNLTGQACDDGILCSVGSTYDANCNCTGGTFPDTDGDGVCDPLDVCPGHDDNVDVNNNNIPDGCEGCTDYIVENTNSIISQNRSAQISIVTNGRVFVGDREYHAGEEVELTDGFEVKLGAVFHAYIAPCN